MYLAIWVFGPYIQRSLVELWSKNYREGSKEESQIVRFSKAFIANGFEGSGHIFQFTLPTFVKFLLLKIRVFSDFSDFLFFQFWLFQCIIGLKNLQCFRLEFLKFSFIPSHFFLTAGQNNFRNKIPLLQKKSEEFFWAFVFETSKFGL